MRIIELRSDTFTLPDEPMRAAMANAEVGDDVFGEDPSINRLQAQGAELLGKEAALFIPSGSMANLIALLVHCERGAEAIMGSSAHMFVYEAASAAVVAAVQPHTLRNSPEGTLDLDEVLEAIRGDDSHLPRTRLLCLESTHNRCWGSPLALDFMDRARSLARENGLGLHLDGARLFNAAIALGVPASQLADYFDSVTFCLSKGLGAPVGSLLCGSRAFIAESHRARKMLGGGMRQAGIIAAGGIYALENNIERLAEDHARAKRLAEGIASIPGLATEPERVRSNIVYFELLDERLSPAEFEERCGRLGLRFFAERARLLRLVTHMEVSDDDVEAALALLREVMAGIDGN